MARLVILMILLRMRLELYGIGTVNTLPAERLNA